MKNFKVEFLARRSEWATVEVEAEDEDQARDLAWAEHDDGMVVWDDGETLSIEIETVEEVKDGT